VVDEFILATPQHPMIMHKPDDVMKVSFFSNKCNSKAKCAATSLES
jgi:hypothetical protein